MKADALSSGAEGSGLAPAGGVAAEPYSLAYRSYVLFALMMVLALSYCDRMLIGVAAPAIAKELHLSDGEIGFLSGTVFAVLYILFIMPVGWLTDRFSRTWICSVALATWSSATALFGLGSTIYSLTAARAAVGMGEAGGTAPGYSLIVDYFLPSQRGRVFAIFGMGVPLGAAGGSIIGGHLIEQIGWRATFIVIGLFGIAFGLLFKLTVREPRRRRNDAAIDRPISFRKSLAVMVRKPAYLAICAGGSFMACIISAEIIWMPSFLIRYFDLSLAAAASIVGAIKLVPGIAGTLLGGVLNDQLMKRERRAPALIACAVFLLAAAPLTAALLSGNVAVAVGFLGLSVFLRGLAAGPMLAAVQHFASTYLRGTATSIYNLCQTLVGMGLGVAAVGYLSDLLRLSYAADSLRYAMLLLPLMAILASASFAFAFYRYDHDRVE